MEPLSEVLKDLSWLPERIDFFSLPDDITKMIYSLLPLKLHALIELSSKASLYANASSKYVESIDIPPRRKRTRTLAKFIFALPNLKHLRIKDTCVYSKVWETIIPTNLSKLESLELQNSSLIGSDWIDILNRRGVTTSLRSFCILGGSINKSGITALNTASSFSQLRVLKLNFSSSRYWKPWLATVSTSFQFLKDLSIPIHDLAECPQLQNLQFLSRLSVVATCGSPTFSLFDPYDLNCLKTNWNAVSRRKIDRMAQILPPNVKPWNFFLFMNRRYELNILSRACYLGNFKFSQALLSQFGDVWNVNAACYRTGRTALIWSLLPAFRYKWSPYYDLCELLLRYGADPFVVDRKFGLMPLHMSFALKTPEVFNLILNAALEKDPSCASYIARPPPDGMSLLLASLIISSASNGGMEWLLDAYRQVKITDLYPNALSRCSLSAKRQMPWLLWWAQKGDFNRCETLFQLFKGQIDFNIRDSSGRTLLHCLGTSTKFLETFLPLSNLSLDDKDDDGKTGADYAVLQSSAAHFLFFYERGQDMSSSLTNFARSYFYFVNGFYLGLVDYVEKSEKPVSFGPALFDVLWDSLSPDVFSRLAIAVQRQGTYSNDCNMLFAVAQKRSGLIILLKLLASPKFLEGIDINETAPLSLFQPLLKHTRAELTLFEDKLTLLELAALLCEAPTIALKLLQLGVNPLGTCGRSHDIPSLDLLFKAYRANLITRVTMEAILMDCKVRFSSSEVVQCLFLDLFS